MAIGHWINTVRGFEPGPLFGPVRKGGNFELRQMTAQAIYMRVKRRALAAGIKTLSPHDLRRTFASGLPDAGFAALVVQKLMRHANIHTTTRYDLRDEESKRKGIRLFHVPYVEFSELR